MEIRIPNIDEYEIVNELAVQVHKLHVGWRPDLFNSVDEVITLDEFMELIQNEEIYVSVIDNQVVGYIVFCIVEKKNINPKFRYRKQLNVDAMCVDEKYRGKGIGTELLNFVEKIAIERACKLFNAKLPDNVKATSDIKEAVEYSQIIVLVVPTAVVRGVLKQINLVIDSNKLFINASKGMEPETFKRVSEIVSEEIDNK